MNRFHVHVNVTDLERSVAFYTQLFGAAPNVLKTDYAKWLLEDPRINFAISRRDRDPGVDHLGIQADDDAELQRIGTRLKAAEAVSLTETGTTCCYARSDKFWSEDPQGVRWETFHTLGEATTYFAPTDAATSADPAVGANAGACCGPEAQRVRAAGACGPAATGGCCA